MNMWGLLMIILAVLSAAGILYLASRIGRFWIIKGLQKKKKYLLSDRTDNLNSVISKYLARMRIYECYCLYSASACILAAC